MECPICVGDNKINKRNNWVTCIHCNFGACACCCKKYIIGDLNDARCMGCNKNWNREFLILNFSYSFVNTTYKKHRENIIFDRQLAMMEETQKIIEKNNFIKNIQTQIQERKQQISNLEREISSLERKKYTNPHDEDKIKFYGHCPVNNCRGFINSSWKCGICQTKVCKTCKEELVTSSDHQCDQNIVESLAKIKRDSRPCPKCKCMIFKIEGCRQMFCTQCHTIYDWITGEIITRGFFHNPHYTEWQRTHGNVVPPNNCRRFGNISPRDMRYILRNHVDEHITYVINFNRILLHIHDIEIPQYRVRTVQERYSTGAYITLRIKYLENSISEFEFKNKLQRLEKKQEKKEDIFMIYDMFYNTGRYIITNIFYENKTLTRMELETSITQIKDLIEYTNKSFVDVSKKYKNKVPQIVHKQNERASSMFYIEQFI